MKIYDLQTKILWFPKFHLFPCSLGLRSRRNGGWGDVGSSTLRLHIWRGPAMTQTDRWSINLSVDLHVYLYIHLSIYLSIYLSVYLSIYLSICLSIYLSIYVKLYSACLHVVYTLWTSNWRDGQMARWLHSQTDGRMDERTDRQTDTYMINR